MLWNVGFFFCLAFTVEKVEVVIGVKSVALLQWGSGFWGLMGCVCVNIVELGLFGNLLYYVSQGKYPSEGPVLLVPSCLWPVKLDSVWGCAEWFSSKKCVWWLCPRDLQTLYIKSMILLIMHTHFFEKVEMGFYDSILAAAMKGLPNMGANSWLVFQPMFSWRLRFPSFQFLPCTAMCSSSQHSKSLSKAGGLPCFRVLCRQEG